MFKMSNPNNPLLVDLPIYARMQWNFRDDFTKTVENEVKTFFLLVLT